MIINFAYKARVKEEMNKLKVFTSICFPVFTLIYIYIKMCMCDQVYFVPDLLRWSECEKCLFLLMRGPICAYTYKCTNKWH